MLLKDNNGLFYITEAELAKRQRRSYAPGGDLFGKEWVGHNGQCHVFKEAK